MNDTATSKPYGLGDASFQAAGGEAGIRAWVGDFYDIMAANPAYARLDALHTGDPDTAKDKLARFLCGWLGGPRRYREKYGPINIPAAHGHLAVTQREHDEWLACMDEALARQPFAEDFKRYVIAQLAVPAGVILARVQAGKGVTAPAG